MTELHVLRVFVGQDGRGGNPLGVFLDGGAIAAGRAPGGRRRARLQRDRVRRRRRRRARSGSSRPASELPFAGHPTVGTAWLLAETGTPVDDPATAGRRRRRPARRRADLDPGPARVGPPIRAPASSPTAAEVERCTGPRARRAGPSTSGPGSTRPPGDLRARYFATDAGSPRTRRPARRPSSIGDRLGAAARRSARASGRSSSSRPPGRQGRDRRHGRVRRAARVAVPGRLGRAPCPR